RGRAESPLHHLREGLRHRHDLARGAVDAAQLAVVAEAAELALPRLEDALDRQRLAGRRPADPAKAAHGGKPGDVHDVWVVVEGCPCDGASPPPSSSSSKKPK